MKLRRAMAAAVATAAIAPVALLAAPAAYATDPAPSVSASESAADGDTTDASSSPSQSTDSTESTESTDSTDSKDSSDSSDSTDPKDSEDTTGTTDDTKPETPADGESSASTSPSPSGSTSPSPSAGQSAPAEEEDPELCVDEEGNSTAGLSFDLKSGLAGLPETIVAGSGWRAFSFNVSNHGDEEIKDIKPLIGVAAIGWDEKDYSGQITVQVFDKATKQWNTLANAAGEGGTFAAFSLGAGQSVSYQLRLSVSGKVPDSLGLTGGLAEYADAEGCWLADDPNGWIYFFDILAAGSDAGEPNDAKPQTGGMAELDEVSDVKVTGSLAETGSNSALPMIGLVGGAAVVAGAGAVFVVRRRKAGVEA